MTLNDIQTYVNANTPYKLTGLCLSPDGMLISLQALRGRYPSAAFSLTPAELALADVPEKAILLARTTDAVARLDYSLTH